MMPSRSRAIRSPGWARANASGLRWRWIAQLDQACQGRSEALVQVFVEGLVEVLDRGL
jgi:hypothetical protein